MSPILLVLADSAFRVPLMTALRARGFTVVLHPDGEDARAYVDINTVALVIVDARLPGGETGDAWIRKRRQDGVTAKMVLCGSTREEVERLVRASGDLAVESVVPKSVAMATIVGHVEELVRAAAPADAAAQSTAIDQLALLIEQTRLSIVQLQRGESRDRVLKGIEEAKRLRTAASAAGAATVVTAAKTIEEILTNVRDGRQRLEHSAFAPMERGLLRARESLGAAGAQASTAPAPAARRASGTSAHVEVEAEEAPAARGGATIDELTGLMTRDGFLRRVEARAEAASIDGRPLSLCVIAVDDAARLRAEGALPAVMKALGGFLASRFRPDDVRGRWSPDGCALAFPATPVAMAVSNMTRTLEAFDTLGHPAKLSVGVASFPKDGSDAAAVFALADRRLQKAQASGGGVRGP